MHILDHLRDTLPAWLAERGVPAFRAGQVKKWLFEKRASDFAAMTDLPKELRTALADDFQLFTMTVAKHLKSPDGTEKLLLQTHDNQRIECVLLRESSGRSTGDGPRRTICISSQVG